MPANDAIPASWLDLPEDKLLAKVRAEIARKRAEQTKGERRFELALDGVFASYAPKGEWLPQEFVVSYTLVRLKVSPGSYAETKDSVLAVLKRLQGKRFETMKGLGKGVRRLTKRVAKKTKRR